eukprot:jgi/Mesvir1/23443/Mv22298-RA.1
MQLQSGRPHATADLFQLPACNIYGQLLALQQPNSLWHSSYLLLSPLSRAGYVMNPVLVFDKFGPLARRGVQGRSSYAPGECLLKPVNNLKGQKAGLRCGSRLLPIAKPWANRCTVRALAASPSSNSGDASNPKARANSNPKGGKPPSPSPSPPSPKSSPPAAKTPAGSKDGSGKAAGSKGAADAAKSSEYSEAMQKRMGDPSLVYRHEAGMNYAVVLPDIMVGSCPQGPEDVDHLREECNVGAIMCLQEDINFAYFNIDIAAIRQRAEQRGDVKHLRVPIADFDPFSLRMNLPKAVAVMHAAMQQFKPGERVYIHCTAGLGRAPGLALAYMMMMRGLTLKEANEKLQAVRPCGPKLDAIRWATVDMLLPRSSSTEVTLSWSRGVSETCELSGLDVGWGPRVPLGRNLARERYELTRALPVGRYEYKYIIDGRWTYNPWAWLDHANHESPNNLIEVVSSDPEIEQIKKVVFTDDVLPKGSVYRERVQERVASLIASMS